MCVNGGVWEAVVQSDLTPVTTAHPDKWESMLEAHQIQLNKMAAIFLNKSASNSLGVLSFVIDFFWSEQSAVWSEFYTVWFWCWAHLSLSKARG